ncbi:MAG: hypothetical protein ACLQGT_10805 [Terracidiphilus sp.]
MKPMSCEHESGVIRALHSGEWSSELRRHATECADCSQALDLAAALREEARRAEAGFQAHDAHWILQRSRVMAREIAVRRVTRLLAAMRALAAVYVAAAALWLLRGYTALPYREVASSMHGSSAGFALMGAMAAAVCVAAGLWPILRERSEAG